MKKKQTHQQKQQPRKPVDAEQLAQVRGGGFLDSGPSDANRIIER
jgi:hypothetical protein